MLVTADALHTLAQHANYLHERGGHFLLTIKGESVPTLCEQLKKLPRRHVPVVDHTAGKGHGRTEIRTLQGTEVSAGIRFPHAHLAIRVVRKRTEHRTGRTHTEIVYAITDLGFNEVTPARLADALRAQGSE